MTTEVRYWPDGFWQYAFQTLPSHRSDDFALFAVPEYIDEPEIEEAVQRLINA